MIKEAFQIKTHRAEIQETPWLKQRPQSQDLTNSKKNVNKEPKVTTGLF